MNWKIKSLIQNLISSLPSSIGDQLYFKIQKKFGGLQNSNVFNTSKLDAALQIWNLILESDCDPKNKIFFELGTGRIPEIPIFLWLFGAKKIITVDLNSLANSELTNKLIDQIVKNKKQVFNLVGKLIDIDRFEKLENLLEKNLCISDLIDLFNIEYISPFDASNEQIEETYIDFFLSYTVLEHIPQKDLEDILSNMKHKLHKGSIMIHYIDYSDHFSHSDPKISSINFLKYSNWYWNLIAGNKYMYMNRLRHDDFLNIFKKLKLNILFVKTVFSQDCYDLIKNDKIKLHHPFNSRPNKINAIIGSWFILNNI